MRLTTICLATLMACGLFRTASAQDATPPTLVDIMLEPKVFDVSEGEALGTLTWHLTDDLSGVAGATQIRWLAPSGQQNTTSALFGGGPISGTNLDGIWESEVSVPQFSEFGVWEVQFLFLQDVVGNIEWIQPPNLTPMLNDIRFTVTPEPSSIVMAAMALAALGWFGWRRRR